MKELGKARSGVGFPISEQGGKEGIPFFKVSDMNTNGNESEMLYANNYVDAIQIKENGWTIISDVPAIIFAKVGAAVLLNRKRLVREPFLLDNNMMEYSISQPVWDLSFALSLFETLNLPSYIQIGALPSYNTSDIENIEIYLPEQQREKGAIGQLFSTIDSLIAAEKRKLDLLKKKKTTLLLQVFDQKLRFKRYNAPWKQRHLGVLLEETNEVASDREILSVTVSNGIYPARDGAKDSNPGESIHKYKVVHINDIVYNSMRLWQGAIGISGYEGIVSPAYTVCHVREVVDARFCAYLLRNYPVLREFYRYSQGNSKDTLILKYPEFSQIIVTIPTSFSEQEDIANTLDCLNQLIAAETRKIDMLRLKKKALLQQMFV